MEWASLIIGSYLLGSVPFGLLIGRAHGVDLRKVGSGNIGATNLSRALGRKWGYTCFCLDMLKGLVPTVVAGRFVSSPPTAGALFLWLGVGCAAVLGHVFPIFVRFKGGKGVATSFGVAVGVWPYYTICAVVALIVWAVVVLIWHYISLGSIIAAVVFPLVLLWATLLNDQWSFSSLWPLFVVATLIPVMVVALHRQNIKRLLAGTENKVLESKTKDSSHPTGKTEPQEHSENC